MKDLTAEVAARLYLCWCRLPSQDAQNILPLRMICEQGGAVLVLPLRAVSSNILCTASNSAWETMPL